MLPSYSAVRAQRLLGGAAAAAFGPSTESAKFSESESLVTRTRDHPSRRGRRGAECQGRGHTECSSRGCVDCNYACIKLLYIESRQDRAPSASVRVPDTTWRIRDPADSAREAAAVMVTGGAGGQNLKLEQRPLAGLAQKP